MNNFAYIITDREENDLFKKLVFTLKKYSNCHLIIGLLEEKEWIISSCKQIFNNNFSILKINKSLWNNRRMACKIESIKQINLNENDRLFILDDDLIFQDDIFLAFDSEFDVCITSRHYKYWYPINGGVWGLKYNNKSKDFLDFFISQINRPNWEPLVKFRNTFRRNNSVDWWVDQDFLCVIKNESLPFPCIIKDIGPSYNFCPSVEESIAETFNSAKKEILSAVNNKNIKILHFKGRLKTIFNEIKI